MDKEKQNFNTEMDCSAQYYALDREKKKTLRCLFIKRTGISHPGFYAKLRRRCWSILDREVFNDIVRWIENGYKEC